MRHLPKRPPRPGARLLDVGCGNGAFLAMAKAAGWQVQGIDFDPQAVAAARSRGLDVICGGLDQILEQEGTYDCITCSHVIEHVHAPRHWITQMHALLRVGGRLWLQTPNISSRGHARFGPDWRGLEPPRHLVLFTPDSLSKLLEESGFTAKLRNIPIIMALSAHKASHALANGQPPGTKARWPYYLSYTTWMDVMRQTLKIQRAEFITIEAVRVE
ncbi:class I SAM-dependent methyltransferase [Rhodoferax sp.]|uniref:class I SAM-dependent methyltransferase n=1 Tax=Rhodoferax sp. TaxID=50421 RepID=UPI00374DBDA6